MAHQTFRSTFALIACLLPGLAWPLDPNRAITQYRHESWQNLDGLPQNTVRSIQQTADGFIWLATDEGLARFDGVRFTTFTPSNTPELTAREISAIAVDAGDTLWIATEHGLSYMRDGRFHRFEDGSLKEIHPVNLLASRGGGVWVVCRDALIHLLNGRVERSIGLPDSSLGIYALTERRAGEILVGGKKGVYRVSDQRLELVKETRAAVQSIQESGDGSVWIGTEEGLLHWKRDGADVVMGEHEGLPCGYVQALWEDRSANLWIGCGRGLARLYKGQLSLAMAPGNLSGSAVLNVFEDRDGQLWVGTYDGGLNRYTDGVFTPFGRAEGLEPDLVFATLEDSKGSLWVGTLGGLERIDGHQVKRYGAAEGIGEASVRGIAETASGTIWVSTMNGVFRFDGERFTRFGIKEGLASDNSFAVLPDSRGNIWFAAPEALTVLQNGRFRKIDLVNNHPDHGAGILHEDRSGRIWAGTTHGLFALDNGVAVPFQGQQTFANNWVFDVVDDSDGTLWVGTNQGIVRLRNGEAKRLTTREGLYDDAAFRMLGDDEGNFWITCNRGIYRVSKRDLNEAADSHSVPSIRTFGFADGLRSLEFNGGAQPAGTRLKDGRLVFPTKGLAIADPSRVRPRRAPASRVEEILVDGHAVAGPLSGPLPAGRNDIEVHFTALTAGDAKALRFRWKLSPYDEGWNSSPDRRMAIYTNLPPGNYQFEVAAADFGGDFGPPTSLEIGFRPHLLQAWWFYALCAMAAFLAITAVWRLRVRNLQQRERWLEAAVAERTAELAQKNTDLDENLRKLRETQAQLVQAGKMAAVGTLAAGVGHEINNPLAYILSNLVFASDEATALAQALASLPPNAIPGPRHPSARLEEMDDAIRDALQGAERVRRIVRDLKIFSRSDEDERGPINLHDVIDSAAKMAANEIRPRARLVKEFGNIPLVEGNDSRLSQVFLNLLINAAHAVGEGRPTENQIVVSTRLEGDHVVAEVRDTGCGMTPQVMNRIFDPFFTTKPVGVGTGLGLSLCHTLVKQMGGQITVESAPGAGTTFRVILPASQAKAPRQFPMNPATVVASRAKVLIVDDEPLVTSALRRALGRNQDIEIVHSGRRALDLLSAPEARFDAVLCDLMMPDMSGMELYAEVERVAPRHLSRFIFVTGGAFTPGAKEFLQRIPNAHVEKPFDPNQIREMVTKQVEAFEKQRGVGLRIA
jgi:signal transduction histidine kinase/ligand-binding sensor domain-containing protein/ActR/RegA family two-component response regulator